MVRCGQNSPHFGISLELLLFDSCSRMCFIFYSLPQELRLDHKW
jgi:hypothetical protein